jgi:hypothetical protein
MDYSVSIRCSGNACLASRWLAVDFCSGSIIPAFRRHVTIHIATSTVLTPCRCTSKKFLNCEVVHDNIIYTYNYVKYVVHVGTDLVRL